MGAAKTSNVIGDRTQASETEKIHDTPGQANDQDVANSLVRQQKREGMDALTEHDINNGQRPTKEHVVTNKTATALANGAESVIIGVQASTFGVQASTVDVQASTVDTQVPTVGFQVFTAKTQLASPHSLLPSAQSPQPPLPILLLFQHIGHYDSSSFTSPSTPSPSPLWPPHLKCAARPPRSTTRGFNQPHPPAKDAKASETPEPPRLCC